MLQHTLAKERRADFDCPAEFKTPLTSGYIRVCFTPHPRRVEQMRRITRTQLRYCGPRDVEAVHTVGLVVSELVTNAIRHGKAAMVTFSLACDASGAIRIEVDDHTLSETRPSVQPFDADAEDGRGLAIVEALTHAWGREGSCTWCTFPAEGGAAA
ncbi:ATP-binding protein [Embleya sp. NPDC005575]|uniref:ATP-binding protein n=1 Tax=Embleya sp. NPDC005575 TaxID=3156892 RepID=UPI0033B4BC5E